MGLDPFKVVVDRAHEKGFRVLGSIRINDAGAPEGSNYTIGRLKYENPDVMIGEEDPNKPFTATALDFARDDVREERLSVIEEVCDRYGADGVEIDEYVRVFFKPSEVAKNIPILTEWMRSVRALLDEIGNRQGRELSLAIRVHPSEQACLDIGMDVRTWIREGIVDWVTPFGDVMIIDPEPHFGWMVEEAREVGVGIYPPLGRDTYDDRFHDVTIEMSRAVAGKLPHGGRRWRVSGRSPVAAHQHRVRGAERDSRPRRVRAQDEALPHRAAYRQTRPVSLGACDAGHTRSGYKGLGVRSRERRL